MLGFSNPVHILFLLVLLLLVFGAKRLPEMGRSLGSGMRGFKESLNGEVNHTAELGQSVQNAPTPDTHVQAGATEAHVQAGATVGEPRP
jgi:sec-independent protein translocase protein TatA